MQPLAAAEDAVKAAALRAQAQQERGHLEQAGLARQKAKADHKAVERAEATWEERWKADRERRERARATAAPFYSLATWWLSIVLNFATCFGAVIAAEWLARWLADTFSVSLQSIPIPTFFLISTSTPWAIAFSISAACFYYRDPERGRHFLTRGLLGGWSVWLLDSEPAGLLCAFPIPLTAGWLLARALSHALHLMRFDHVGLVFSTFVVGAIVLAGFYALAAAADAF